MYWSPIAKNNFIGRQSPITIVLVANRQSPIADHRPSIFDLQPTVINQHHSATSQPITSHHKHSTSQQLPTFSHWLQFTYHQSPLTTKKSQTNKKPHQTINHDSAILASKITNPQSRMSYPLLMTFRGSSIKFRQPLSNQQPHQPPSRMSPTTKQKKHQSRIKHSPSHWATSHEPPVHPTSPVIEQQGASTISRTPNSPRQSQVFHDHQSPIANHTFTNHRSRFVHNHQSSITNHQSPITNHRSPITDHQNHRSRVFNNRQSPIINQQPAFTLSPTTTNHHSHLALLELCLALPRRLFHEQHGAGHEH